MIDNKIKVLQMVEHYGSVTAAATALSYTPSAVSYQLRQLAEQVGAKLLEPSGRGISLTPAARTLLRHAVIMQQQWETARSEIAATYQHLSGTFTLCGFSTAASHLLPYALATLSKRHPDLKVRLVEAEPVRCFDLLLAETIDLALVLVTAETPPLSDERFDQQLLLDDPLDLVVPTTHPLAAYDEVPLSSAALEPWVIATPGSAYHKLTVSACVAAGFTPDIAHQADEWETGAALVAQGLCVMLVPRLGGVNPVWPVKRIRLTGEPAPTRRIMAATRKGGASHPLVAQTLELVKTASANMSTHGVPPSAVGPTADESGAGRAAHETTPTAD
ncbi:LysR family transcriptional regulator [Glutamicibacter sp. MNS18]|uniref:LysR family transcriptional regulator n=1 Tax=Glutamicibacter sp. MNS18 TaxID=2989817 RepID=UPI0022357C3B|nr:LysR family transcriptional regulator [Glutamicibacter sp. MNS18]MCW4466797.1 LysR family transcriptional regulator [Glutamicibacter sp. MNS18]